MIDRDSSTAADAEQTAADTTIDGASAPYLGRWHRLISTTNWEKGRIIQEWRVALSSAGANASEFADDAWSRRVGNVTGQHVGRLRRVYERFGATASEYPGLYWSHFQAALDWDDAEMWLEGAVHSRWSVAEMRRQRWTTRAATEGRAPDESEPESDSPDEDFSPLPLDVYAAESAAVVDSGNTVSRIESGKSVGDGQKRRDSREPAHGETDDEPHDEEDSSLGEPQMVRAAPFAHLAELPEDFAEAFEAFKLAIVRHRLLGWREASRDDVLAALDALRELALAPVDSN